MSDNAPENVDLDEKFNSIDPVILQAILVRNMTVTSRSIMQKNAQALMPIVLGAAMGFPPSEEDYQQALLGAYKTIAIVLDLSKLIDEIVPIHDEEMSEERRDEVKEIIKDHPMILAAKTAIVESIDEKLAKRGL